MTVFEVINCLRRGESWRDEFKDVYSPYLANKYFSNAKKYLNAALIADNIIDCERNYNFWKGIIVKKEKRIFWIKNSKKSEEIECIARYFNTSVKKAREYDSLLKEEDKTLIINNIKGVVK